jgi:hypothetical protein
MDIGELFFLKKSNSCFANSNPFLNLSKSYEIEHSAKTHPKIYFWRARFHLNIEKLVQSDENNRKQILVVAFFNFPRESSESRCLISNCAQHSRRLTGFPGKPFFMSKNNPE